MKKSKKLLAIGWFLAALLLAFYPVSGYTAPELAFLYRQYTDLSVEQLLGEYNSAVDFHDSLRAKIINNLKEPALTEFISSDDQWCSSRQEEFQNAAANKDKQAIIEMIVLENLRNGTLLEKIPWTFPL